MNGYTAIYLDERDRVYCERCAPEGATCHGYPEGPALDCEGCDAVIESDYGDPAEEGAAC